MSAWTVIQHQELSGNESSITFSNIPASYTDIVLYVSGRTTLNVYRDDMFFRLNGDSTTSYLYNFIRRFENGSLEQSNNTGTYNHGAIFSISGASSTGSSFSNVKLTISNYAGSTLKSYMLESAMGNLSVNSDLYINAGLWNNTAAITSITLASLNSTPFVTNSSATLYGITAGSSGGVTVS